ncbi:hypothetical protein BDN71DRAFT_1509407 [Pleurotus eryngii]|uniref:Uncharacterized protein n=1 Tax=Pleurotus eryngii TaxID=5323 RepID=A0A9P5ZRR4_PLEER|nr:hypothetical protein BDN71DRAFT_1509407 [Pleurotus eryngii]
MEDLWRKNHALIDLINKVTCQSLKAILNRTNAFWSEGPDLSLEEVFAEFRPDSDVGPSETHDRYFRTLPSGSERSGDTLDQASKIRDAQFPLIYNLQPLTPIEPKDDGSIPHITSANRPHDRLASVFRTPKLSEPQAVATSDDEASLGGESTEDPSSTDEIADDHHASLAASDDEASLGGQSTEDPSSDDEMANDESMEENTPGVDLSRHHQHTPPAEQEAKDDDDAMSLGSYTDDEADNSHTFSMAEMQANISHIPSSPEVGRRGSLIDEVDDAYSEYSDDSDGDVDIPDDVQAYLQTSHTPGFQSRYQHVHFEHIPDAEFADDVL